MIYLTNGNMPLNEAYNDEIVQEHNNTYQLTFRFPTSDPKWELLKEETFLTADDLHGEQDFYIFEIEKQQGYIQVYANQVFSLLNNYVVNAINLDRETGASALSRFAGSITRTHPFSFFSDIWDRHTFNIDSKNAMEAFAKDKHSILGQWGGDLVRHGYQVRLLKNGGSENESLFMYKKNLSSYQHKTSTKSLRTRITFKTTIKGEGEKAPDKHYSVTIESPLINKYNQIYEDVVEVNDQDVKDEASLRKYGEQYFRTTLCDMMEDSLEIEVVGQSDVPVQMFDVVSIYHEGFDLDVRKKITKYTYSPMAKKLKSIGFGQFKSGLANAIGTMVSDALKNETQGLLGSVDAKISKELKNADLAFDQKKEELVNQFTDELNAAKAKAEEVKRQISSEIDKKFQSFDNASIQEAKRKAEEALRSAGASSLLAQEAKRISLDSIAKLEAFKSQATSAQTALSGDLDALKRTVTSEVNQASEYRRTTTEALSRMTGQMNGFATKSEVRQDVVGLTETFAKLKTDTNNLISGAKSEITLAKTEFKKTADGLSAKMSAVESYVGQDGQRQEALRRYTREESARQATAVREQISRDYVGKNIFQESVQGVERRLESLSLGTSGNLLKNSNEGFYNQHDKRYRLVETLQANQVYTLVTKYWHGENATGHTFLDGIGNWRHLTYNSAIDAWMVQFTPAQKIPAGTEITLSSDPGRSVGNLSWATLVRGAIPLIHWQPAKGDVEEGVAKKMAEYKETVDGRFATISSQINGKVNQADFQRVKETSQLYERIIGSNENDISNKVARMVMTSQLFQVEVSKNEGLKTVQRQLAGSWSVQNLTSAGSIVSQINATNNQILIEAEKIRLKGKSLLDELTAIQGYFKRLFVGEGAFAKLNAEIIGSKTITADKLIMDQAMARMFVSSNIFTDMLAAKEAFISKLRSVVVTATLLEGYKGKIGGFQIGTHDNDPSSFWLTGLDQFKVGMSNGRGRQFQTAFWANWGNDWGKPGPLSWYVTLEGKMFCRNDAAFHRVVDFSSTSIINFYGSNNFHKNIEMKGGTEIYGTGRSPRENGKNAVIWWSQVGDGTVKYYIDKVSDRRLKENITETSIQALDKINQLAMVAFDFIDSKKHEEIGLIAQDVEAVIPQAISQNPENPDGYLHIDYTALVPYLIKAIQELNQKIEKLEKTA